jgi:hypothetical protein
MTTTLVNGLNLVPADIMDQEHHKSISITNECTYIAHIKINHIEAFESIKKCLQANSFLKKYLQEIP